MRIAFDLDGVLADLHGSFANTAIRLFPELDRSIVGSPEIGASPPDLEEFPTEIARCARRECLADERAIRGGLARVVGDHEFLGVAR